MKKQEISQSQEIDLERTDRLPVLEGTIADHDVEDDAVPLDHSASVSASPAIASQRASPDFHRPTSLDLPSLAESIRSVEERITRQRAEYEALLRSYELVRDAEATAVARANAVSGELSAARAALESEQQRSRELDNRLSETSVSAESARTRAEEAVREAERQQSDAERYHNESRSLLESLASRDATIVQVLHSLGERDAQLAALQKEQAKIVPALEARVESCKQLEADLQSARAQTNTVRAELKSSNTASAAQASKLKRGESELSAARLELTKVKSVAQSYLERLRTREFRHGFNQNLFRELDAQVGAASANLAALGAERDQLKRLLGERDAKLAAQDETIGKLNSAVASDAATSDQRAQELQRSEQARADLAAQLAALQSEGVRLHEELAAREGAVAEARAIGTTEAQRVKDLLAAAEQRQAEQAAQIAQLQAEAQTSEQEMTVLMAHLQEARRPIQSIQAEVKRMTDELAAKTLVFEELNEENQKLRAALERTRGALEEREFLIRRLERAESNNANALGRIQTSMERLGAPAPPAAGSPPIQELAAELIRIDGDRMMAHPLVRRTRIGRAHGCELHIDSSSVSRHHALVLVGPRDAIIEDLNSTNGVIVNGRKITRQLLHDGDAVTIGEVQFRFEAKHAPRTAESGAAEPPLGA